MAAFYNAMVASAMGLQMCGKGQSELIFAVRSGLVTLSNPIGLAETYQMTIP